MTPDLKKIGIADLSVIDISKYWQLKYWANRFGVIPEILSDAVYYSGPIIKDIREWLYERGHLIYEISPASRNKPGRNEI